ncbi:hypothetical protein GCM10007304_30060 [Rhodococcoides trifolii]|uniref:Uncharacterized protein n=1 Tax=Rhodococcoides trifolii TaxID=908250 RepID=A0A917LCD5_9NOCA|nr:hypothetical protein [Rhodococcus trifolii]GGG13991.1 hypothetical protein GCM10007304_30060 [Rhodococcus trifolii]
MIDDVLETGAVGLTYFDTFLGRANSAGAGLDVTSRAISDRYNEQCGIDVQAISAAGTSLLTASRDLGAVVADQRASLSRLSGNWSGSAADAASAMIDAQLTQADADIASLRTAGDALAAAATAVVSTVTDKAAAAATFGRPDVDGRSADQVDAVLAASRLCPDLTSQQLMSLAPFHPETAPGAARSDPTSLISLSVECASWLSNVFVPTVQERVSAFLEMCAATDDAVRDILSVAASAFDGFAQSQYPSPERERTAEDCGCLPSQAADIVAQQHDSESTASAAATTPVTTAHPEAASTSGGASGPMRTIVDAVRDILAAEVRDPIVQPTIETPSTATESAPSPERAHVEAELDGHGIRFALSADGTISVELGDTGHDGAHCATDTADPPPETPTAETPTAETPAAETPTAETPIAGPPEPETPAADPPEPETPAADPPEPEPPVADTPEPAPAQQEPDDTSSVCVVPPAPEPEPALASAEPIPAEVATPDLAEAGRL